jgi:hypothetical protein
MVPYIGRGKDGFKFYYLWSRASGINNTSFKNDIASKNLVPISHLKVQAISSVKVL